MADEPENLVLVQLREIRAKLAKLDEHDQRFDRLDQHAEVTRYFVRHALGLGGMNEIKARELDIRHDDFAARQKRTEEMIAELDRRLAKVEEKVD